MPDGAIKLEDVNPDPQPKVPAQTGSNIQAAAGVLAEKNETHGEAVNALGGGSRRRRHRRTLRGGAVEVKSVPAFVSAGGTDPKATYAGLLQAGHAAKAAGAYDGLGDKPPINMNSTGGRRKRKTSVKRNNGRKRSKRTALLRSRRTRRGSRRVRHSRR